MIVKGKARGHGRQLVSYWLTLNDNERIRILYVDGQLHFCEKDLRNLLTDFSLNEKLTKSRQGIYHCFIRPEDHTSNRMTDNDWLWAVDVLAQETGFDEQRRAVVLHYKDGGVHAHIAFERYHHESGKMIPIHHNYRKHDRARAKLEQMFVERLTPQINKNRKAMKLTLTELWQQTTTAAEFIKTARQHGYLVTKGYDKVPFMVIDQMPRSFNLVRHLTGIGKREVWDRFKEIGRAHV